MSRCAAVVVGASAGGIAAVRTLLGRLSPGFPVPILLVLHIGGRANVDFGPVFGDKIALRVKEADEKESSKAATVYVAPAGYHLLVERGGTLSLSVDEPVNFSRPSIDVLFESAATAFGRKLVAVLMTGASRDGADGLKRVKAAGGRVLIQDPVEAEARVMPQAGIEALGGEVDLVASVERLGDWLEAYRTYPGYEPKECASC